MAKHPAFIVSFFLLLLMSPSSFAADRFVDNGDGTVTDNELKLMWSKNDNHGDINWHQAAKWVKYTFSVFLPKSYDNWRMPTLDELQSLVDKDFKYETDCGLTVHTVSHIRLSCGWVWTAESDPNAPSARVFNFDNVYHYTVRKAHRRGYRVLAVRNLE